MKHVLAALLLTACGVVQAQAPFLWTIERGGARHFLAGSIHLLPDGPGVPPAIDRAYAAAAGLVFESDLAALAAPERQADLLRQAAAPAGGLQRELGERDYARLQAQVEGLGLPPTLCDAFKAWFCALSLEVLQFQQAGFRADLGVDQQLHARAVAHGKPVGWLETPDEHLALFHRMPAELSRKFLLATLDELDDADGPQELLRIWRSGDLAALDRLTAEFKREHPDAYDRLLAARNRAWAQRLPGLLKGKPQLVVVGAAHLAGPDALPGLLQKAGWKVQATGPAPSAAGPAR